MRYVNYDKCEGCLKCVEVCEHGAIEIIELEEGKLEGFEIDPEKCILCKTCLQEDFCFAGMFELETDEEGNEKITFKSNDTERCFKCLKCFKSCPNNAIIPKIR